MLKFYLTGNNCNNLRFILKKWGNLGKNWDPTRLELVGNFSTTTNKVEELIQLIINNKKAWDVVRTIYWQDIFLFTYEVWKSADVNTDFPDPRHNVNNFMSGATVVVEFQIMLCKFKTCNKVDIVKTYLFRLFGIYLIDDPVQSIMLISDKC